MAATTHNEVTQRRATESLQQRTERVRHPAAHMMYTTNDTHFDDASVASVAAFGSTPKELDSYPTGTQLKSGIGEDSNIVGGGGCTAWALFKLGVSASPEAAMTALNNRIGNNIWCKENDTWHPEVVKKAVIDAGFHFHKVELAHCDLRSKLKKGMYIVDGVLNDSYVKRGYAGIEYRQVTDPEDSTTPYNNEGAWRHAIAVSDGQVLEKEFDMSSLWLWLDDSNNIDRTKGYMYKICKVYRISKCSGVHGCRGACVEKVCGKRKGILSEG